MVPEGMFLEAVSDVESAEIFIEGTVLLPEECSESRAIFGNKIITPVLKALPKSTVMTVSMMDNMPMKLSIDEDNYSMDIFIAPYLPQE